jgi:hypothetical protein
MGNIPERRFPPWTVEEYRGISYIVRDANYFPVVPFSGDLVGGAGHREGEGLCHNYILPKSDRRPACSGDVVVNPGLKSDRDRCRVLPALQGEVAGADQVVCTPV